MSIVDVWQVKILIVIIHLLSVTFAEIKAKTQGSEYVQCMSSLCNRIQEYHFYTAQNREMESTIRILNDVSKAMRLLFTVEWAVDLSKVLQICVFSSEIITSTNSLLNPMLHYQLKLYASVYEFNY